MADQAEGLRRWIRHRVGLAAREVLAPRLSGARVLAVTSGKGGVGKSMVTLNLSLALASRGQRVVVLDADLGLANINIMLGYEPDRTLWDVVERKASLRDIVQEGPGGIRIIPGGSGIAALAQLESKELFRIIEGFRELEDECDWLIVDTGAGISPNVLSFVLAADEVLIVTNPEPTAMADAYGVIKAVWEQEGRAAMKLVMNRAKSREQGMRMGERLATLAAQALDTAVEFLGTVGEDPNAGRSVLRQDPLVLAYPRSEAAMDIINLADRLLDRLPPPRRGGWGAFVERLVHIWPRLLADADDGPPSAPSSSSSSLSSSLSKKGI